MKNVREEGSANRTVQEWRGHHDGKTPRISTHYPPLAANTPVTTQQKAPGEIGAPARLDGEPVGPKQIRPVCLLAVR